MSHPLTALPLSRTRRRGRASRPLATLTVAALALAVSACANVPGPLQAEVPAPLPGAAGDPRASVPLVIDNCGFTTTVSATPQRIVTIKSTSTELLLALGLADRIVATAFHDGPVPEEWAQDASGIPSLGDAVPGREALLEVEPDFVFAGWESNLSVDTAGDRAELARFGVGTYVAPSACKGEGYRPSPMTFELLFDHFLEAGDVFGAPEAARQLVREQRAALDAIVPSAEPLTALWYSSGKATPYVGAGTGAPQMMMTAAGLTNIVAEVDDTWVSINWERVLDADPDVIVLVDAAWNTAESKIAYFNENPALAQLSAVKNERFVVVPFPAAEAGVRSVGAVASIVAQLDALASE